MKDRPWLCRVFHLDPPMFDRDASGRQVHRCVECLRTWPVLPEAVITLRPEVTVRLERELAQLRPQGLRLIRRQA